MKEPDWEMMTAAQHEVFRTAAAYHRNQMLHRIEQLLWFVAAIAAACCVRYLGWW